MPQTKSGEELNTQLDQTPESEIVKSKEGRKKYQGPYCRRKHDLEAAVENGI